MKVTVIRALPFGDNTLPKGTILTADAADYALASPGMRSFVAPVDESVLLDDHHGDAISTLPKSLADLKAMQDGADAQAAATNYDAKAPTISFKPRTEEVGA